MIKKKTAVTRTLNPLHFEDLEPHRFEDLVRRLLYGFRDWVDIEPTGRAGSDAGFDVRAWERDNVVTNVDDEGEEGVRAPDGHLWQIQGKREKSITPARMKVIIQEDIDSKKPPYGYILAAATNISKVTYDVFRDVLRAKGVKEFYFWGKDYLEDQLALPKNDEILFTFFGISLSPQRKSRISEIKFGINNKNKILKLVFGDDIAHEGMVRVRQGFLLRDIKDIHYPWKAKYPDFNKKRRWEEHEAVQVTAEGVIFKAREWYAYYDEGKKEWDYTKAVDLMPRKHSLDATNEARHKDAGKLVERYWRHLPRRVQAKLVIYGFIPFKDILIIDDKGDPEYTDPHVFVDFGEHGPFEYVFGNLVQFHRMISDQDLMKFKRRKVFPSRFPQMPKERHIHDLETLGLNQPVSRAFGTLYSFDGQLKPLREGDLIRIPKSQDRGDQYLEITHVYTTTVGAEVKAQGFDHCKTVMKNSAKREIADDEGVTVYETIRVMLPSEGHGPGIYLDD